MENASKALIIAGAILISILLITIGIVLINSGRDVVDTGTSGMTSQKIQTFNSQFTVYEGTQKGSNLKDLASIVRASNASDSEHQVALYIDKNVKNNAGTSITTLSGLTGSKEYTVELVYAEATTTAYPTDTAFTSLVKPTFNSENGYVIQVIVKP